jgi:four helix bundle protein
LGIGYWVLGIGYWVLGFGFLGKKLDMGDFRQLIVWRKAKDLAVYVYKVTDSGPISKDYGLRDQMRRAAVSIPSNIAEGEELGSNRQSIRHFNISKGSSAELLTQSIIALEISYLTSEQHNHIEQESVAISKMLFKLIGTRSNNLEEPDIIYPAP